MNQPDWIREELSPCDIAAISHGGCDSGAYMPAVTNHLAEETMAEHGDNVLDYIQDAIGELPTPPSGASWSGLACFYLSQAVELWVAENSHLADWECQ